MRLSGESTAYLLLTSSAVLSARLSAGYPNSR